MLSWQQARFELFEGISIKGLEVLPSNVEEYYPIIVRDDIDFLIIDHNWISKWYLIKDVMH